MEATTVQSLLSSLQPVLIPMRADLPWIKTCYICPFFHGITVMDKNLLYMSFFSWYYCHLSNETLILDVLIF
jgi:hypothetical protein